MSLISLIYGWISTYFSLLWQSLLNHPAVVAAYFLICTSALLAFCSVRKCHSVPLSIARLLLILGIGCLLFNQVILLPWFHNWYDIPFSLAVGTVLCRFFWQLVAWAFCSDYNSLRSRILNL